VSIRTEAGQEIGEEPVLSLNSITSYIRSAIAGSVPHDLPEVAGSPP